MFNKVLGAIHIPRHWTSPILLYQDCIVQQSPLFLSLLFTRHLNGAVLETLSRPSLLITDSFNALNVQARRRERDTQLMSKLHIQCSYMYRNNYNLEQCLKLAIVHLRYRKGSSGNLFVTVKLGLWLLKGENDEQPRAPN